MGIWDIFGQKDMGDGELDFRSENGRFTQVVEELVANRSYA